MSSLPGYPGLPFGLFGAGGFGFPQLPAIEDAPTERQQPKAPAAGEEADRGSGYLPWGPWGASSAYAAAPGYPDVPPGNLRTWRLMDTTCPPLTLVRTAVIAPICGVLPTWEIHDASGKSKPARRGPLLEGEQIDPLDQRAELLERMFKPLWADLIYDCCRALSLGHYPFEQVWAVKEGRNWLSGMEGFRPEDVQLVVDRRTRQFLGLRPFGNSGQELSRAEYKAFNCHYDAEARNWYGRPRHANALSEWWKWLEDDAQGHRLDLRATGMVFTVEAHPDLILRDSAGNQIAVSTAAKSITDQLTTGHSVFVPSTPYDRKTILAKPELAESPAFKITRYDLGQTGPASEAILNKMRHREQNLVRGWCRPEREVLEATRGGIGQSDSGTHGQVGIQDSETIQAGLYRQINRGPVNDVLALNFGNDAKDSVSAAAPPLADPQVQFLQKLMLTVLQDTSIAPEILARIGLDDWLRRTEVPAIDDPAEIEANRQKIASAKKPATIMVPALTGLTGQPGGEASPPPPPPGNARIPAGANGNGRMNLKANPKGQANRV